MKFYQCAICGNQVTKLRDSGRTLVCCGQPMQEMVPGLTEASLEKHLPVLLEDDGGRIQVGQTLHPMQQDHYIEWILLETDQGAHIRFLIPGEDPSAAFPLEEKENRVSLYAECNLHGLWETPL